MGSLKQFGFWGRSEQHKKNGQADCLQTRTARRCPGAGIAAICIVALAGSMIAPPALAAQNGVFFGANLTYNNACVIIVQQDGTMVQNGNATVLSSKFPGGIAGIADVYSLSRYYVTVDAPGFFTTPPNASFGTVFSTLFSGQSIFRGRTFAEQPGTSAVQLNNGYSITRLTVNLDASRPSGFPAGDYTAYTTVRCEP